MTEALQMRIDSKISVVLDTKPVRALRRTIDTKKLILTSGPEDDYPLGDGWEDLEVDEDDPAYWPDADGSEDANEDLEDL